MSTHDTHTLWLVRHATPLVAKGICYGRLDVAAEASATRRAADVLAAAAPWEARLVASPARRCTALARLLHAARPDLRRTDNDPRILEMNFGAWEGRTWDAIGQTALDAWTNDFARHAPGGGETVEAFMARVAVALDEARRHDGPTVWITHAGVIRAAGLLARGIRSVAQATDWPAAAPAFGRWKVMKLAAPAT